MAGKCGPLALKEELGVPVVNEKVRAYVINQLLGSQVIAHRGESNPGRDTTGSAKGQTREALQTLYPLPNFKTMPASSTGCGAIPSKSLAPFCKKKKFSESQP